MIIGIIYGCFDLFHVGHLRILQAASQKCDKLWIGVFTDQVITEYKKQKPVIPLEQRVEILRNLKLNSQVQVFGQDYRGPVTIDADILFISEKLNGQSPAMMAPSSRCKVVYLPYTDEVSTTKIKFKVAREGYATL